MRRVNILKHTMYMNLADNIPLLQGVVQSITSLDALRAKLKEHTTAFMDRVGPDEAIIAVIDVYAREISKRKKANATTT